MTNTNSYDCSYEKPLLEGIMDGYSKIHGWLDKKDTGSEYQSYIVKRAITDSKSLMRSPVFATDLDGDDFVTFFIKVMHIKDTSCHENSM